MPISLRVGAAAMNALGVEFAKDGQSAAFVALGDDHRATCYADGLQVIMDTTFGKGNPALEPKLRQKLPFLNPEK